MREVREGDARLRNRVRALHVVELGGAVVIGDVVRELPLLSDLPLAELPLPCQ